MPLYSAPYRLELGVYQRDQLDRRLCRSIHYCFYRQHGAIEQALGLPLIWSYALRIALVSLLIARFLSLPLSHVPA